MSFWSFSVLRISCEIFLKSMLKKIRVLPGERELVQMWAAVTDGVSEHKAQVEEEQR